MATDKPTMKMPELLVFARMFVIGFIAAETLRIAFYLGANFANELNEVALWAKVVGILATIALCLTYSVKRNAHKVAARMGRSFRIDLLVTVAVGVWSNELFLPWLSTFHAAFKAADP
ncbi:hypothetical protein [Chromobacterium amazonense]|uniref:hypothetical protein n=1 Tax=Chromobacterium amazonense TaxID=1382803 RepID=UPI0031F60287